MFQKNLISVIIPVYNSEKYLKKCVLSIIEQIYINIEIILIDDGSSDSSGKICDDFSLIDNRIKVYHQNNKGVSNARNFGIRQAKGKYLIFIDSDDYCNKDLISTLYRDIIKTNSQLSICGYFLENEGVVFKEYNENYKKLLTSKELFTELLKEEGFQGYLWNKLLSAEIIKRNNILFDERIFLNEDLLFLCQYSQHIEKAVYNEIALYHYICRDCSLSRDRFSLKKITSIDAFLEIYNLSIDNKEAERIASNRVIIACFESIKLAYLSHREKEYVNKIKKILITFCSNKKVKLNQKIKLVIIKIHPKLFYILSKKKIKT